MDRFDRALDVVTGELVEEFGDDLLGLLMAGSVAYGTPMHNSDLDLYVLIRPGWRQRRNRVREGVEVEMLVNPVAQIRRELETGVGPTAEMFSRGRICLDPTGVVAELVSMARRVEARTPVPPGATQVYFIRYRPSDLIRDVEDLLEVDRVAAGLLLVLALDAVLAAHWELRGRMVPKPKHRLEALRNEARETAEAAERILDPAIGLAERVTMLRELGEMVLEPIGGLMLEGETNPERVGEEESGRS